ncbi:pectin lyase-like protein [Trichodelitschia bisporula]|uniref:Pectin lyase-like protein n=1 Tax=Trichodelitschia bisporula TaxID=703511 RepID=A0A6G1HJ31_9PEZI|nr:pectin lyase-like protein [Trichodelitschia bisporula]
MLFHQARRGSSSPLLTLAIWLMCLPEQCFGSYMFVGPPGAPVAHDMNSAAEGIAEFASMNGSTADASGIGAGSRSWNASEPPWHSRYRNLSAEAATNFSSSDVEGGPPVLRYWFLTDPSFKHQQPYAGENPYVAFRNVKSYGAKGDGVSDDSDAINNAVRASNRCGEGCSATSTKGAIVYFPPGTYVVKKPIIQYYYTSFIGNPEPGLRPVIKGHKEFEGIALIDTDVYIEQGNGATWWINQNNFYRQIRNFVIDLTDMPNYVKKGPKDRLPVGIHWQVSQACTMQNVHFAMPVAAEGGEVRHTGIYMENGSGGFVSDLTFLGGRVGFMAGNQQYTGRNLRFKGCQTAIEMIWDWGFSWKSLSVVDCKIGINATGVAQEGGGKAQGTASLTLMDSVFQNVDQVLLTAQVPNYKPNIVLDNVKLQGNIGTVVSDGESVLLGHEGDTVESWAIGNRFTKDEETGNNRVGPMEPPRKDPSLLTAGGKFFEREKPQYNNLPAGSFFNILDFNVRNDGVYPNQNAVGINRALKLAAGQNKVVVFPAGVYKVDDTIFIPPGSRIVGVLWSQLMAVGEAFQSEVDLKVLAKVGNPGDKGVIEISDMMFTGSGPTRGAIFMEWNIKESHQGSAAMWDTIFRVGGAQGTDLLEKQCHQFQLTIMDDCMASSMMLHVTKEASIYMENMWLWVADHDIESKNQQRINVYGGRGVLIESQGPSWVHSVSNEHSTLYNWQLAGAKNIYLGAIQSETPYFQAGQTDSLEPYDPYIQFPEDPDFLDCPTNSTALDTCREAWALRIIDSRNVYLYGGGFYSFFQNYNDRCATRPGICQDRLVDTDRSENVWMYNLYTVGAKEVISPQSFTAIERAGQVNGFSTATSAWLVLADQGGKRGGRMPLDAGGDDNQFDASKVPPICDWNLQFASLEALEKAKDGFPQFCAVVYSLIVLHKELDKAVTGYRKEQKDYDAKFKYYEHLFRENLDEAWRVFITYPRGE